MKNISGFKFVMECERGPDREPVLFSTVAPRCDLAVDAAKARVHGITRVLKVRQLDDKVVPVDVFAHAYTALAVKTGRIL